METIKKEKRRKGIESMYKIMFISYVAYVSILILLKILHFMGVNVSDISSMLEITIYIIVAVFMYICMQLAKEGKKTAAIIGIIIGSLEVLFGGIIDKILGAMLLVDSIMYLTYLKK